MQSGCQREMLFGTLHAVFTDKLQIRHVCVNEHGSHVTVACTRLKQSLWAGSAQGWAGADSQFALFTRRLPFEWNFEGYQHGL